MAPPRTASVRSDAMDSISPNPGVSLLWGHQLKREHGYLLERMNKVETGHQAFDARIRSAESAASALKEAAEDVKRLVEDNDEIDKARAAWIVTAETRLGQLKEDINRIRTVQPRVSELEGQVEGVEERVQGLVTEQERLRQQVKILEEELQSKEKEMEVLRKKKVDGSVIRTLMQRLDAMETKARDEEKKRDALQARINQLEISLQRHSSATKSQQSGRQAPALLAPSDFSLPGPEAPTQMLPASEVAAQILPNIEEPTQLLGSGGISTQMLDDMMVDMPTPKFNAGEVPTQLLNFGNRPPQQLFGTPRLNPQSSHLSQVAPREESPIFAAQARKTAKPSAPTKKSTRPRNTPAQKRPHAQKKPATQRSVAVVTEVTAPRATVQKAKPTKKTHRPNTVVVGSEEPEEPEEPIPRPAAQPKRPSKKAAPKKAVTASRRSMIVVLKFDKAKLTKAPDTTKLSKAKGPTRETEKATRAPPKKFTTHTTVPQQQPSKKIITQATPNDRSRKRKRDESESEDDSQSEDKSQSEDEMQSDYDDGSRSETPDLDAPYYLEARAFREPPVSVPSTFSTKRVTRSQMKAQATQRENVTQPPASREPQVAKRPVAKKARQQVGGKMLPAQLQKGRPQIGGKRMPAVAGPATSEPTRVYEEKTAPFKET